MYNLGTYVAWRFEFDDACQADYGFVVGYGVVHHGHHQDSPTQAVSSVILVEPEGESGVKAFHQDSLRRAGKVIARGGRYITSYTRLPERPPIYACSSKIDDALVFRYATPGRQALYEDAWHHISTNEGDYSDIVVVNLKKYDESEL